MLLRHTSNVVPSPDSKTLHNALTFALHPPNDKRLPAHLAAQDINANAIGVPYQTAFYFRAYSCNAFSEEIAPPSLSL
jgi:hypothetical protein